MDHAKIDNAYDRWAASYDADFNRTRDLDGAVMRDTFAGQRFDAILELGCGTGKNTLLLESCCTRLVGVDFSDQMLALAREKVRSPHVSFVHGDITKPLAAPDASFELVTCNLVLEHVEHLGPIFAEACRVLRPGGTLFVSELHPFRQYGGTRANFSRDGASIQIGAFIHHVSDYAAAALAAGLRIEALGERWHADDGPTQPRLLTLLCRRPH
ncbi:MAG: class I SAM-dependent methyltransferase [Planctomycetota bacterium]|nr:class I SAM-dependent methyltransferase [Planctomycetota bacterium]